MDLTAQHTLSVWKSTPCAKDGLPHVPVEKHTKPFSILCASVRGKQHKHEGTPCDDWFEIKKRGQISIIAVADGAGSKKSSRYGARIACKSAVSYLTRHLPIDISSKNEVMLKSVLLSSIQYALKLICHEAKNNGADIDDYSTTLLIAIHVQLPSGESTVISISIGDGAIAVIDSQFDVTVMSKPERGTFAGETAFITSKGALEESKVMLSYCRWSGILSALMVMTDGVAEDYFPFKDNIPSLYGDLIINTILSPNKMIVEDPDVRIDGQSISADGNTTIPMYSFERYVAKNNINPQSYFRSGDTVGGNILSPELRGAKLLEFWLDTYYRRGSFDDRTLIILSRNT